jgi:hemoglobin/transferrin/lactoferrin receptor protein
MFAHPLRLVSVSACVSMLGFAPAMAQQQSQGSVDLPEVVVEAPEQQAAPKKPKPSTAGQASSPVPVAAPATAQPGEPTNAGGPLATGSAVTITSGDLARTQPQNVQRLFATESAVSVGGSTAASYKVYVHGIEETLLNVQIDGARQPAMNGFHHNSNNLVDPAMLKGVAVDAGASPADAGPHALGGSLRYTTKDARDFLKPGQTMGGFTKFSYDFNADVLTRSGAAYGMSNGFEILGYASWADGDAYEDGHGDTVRATDVDLTNFLGKIAYESLSGDRFSLSGEHIEDQGIRPFRANFALVPGQPADSYNEFTRETVTFNYETTRPTPTYDPEVTLYYNKNTLYRPHLNPPAQIGPFTCSPGVISGPCVAYGRSEIESYGGKAQNTFAFGPGKLTTGADFYHDRTKSDHLGSSEVLGERLTDIGVYAQYRADLFADFRLSTGIRGDWQRLEADVDNSEQENFGVSPNVSGEYELAPWLTAKASYGYTFGGVPLQEVLLIRTGNPLYSLSLDPQKSHSTKAGLEFHQDGFVLEGNYFRTRIVDPVCPNCGVVVNQDDIITQGFDITASYAWSSGFVKANFTHTETEFGDNPLTITNWYYGTPMGDILKISGHYAIEGTDFAVGFLSQFAFEYDGIADMPVAGGTYGVLEAYNVHDVFLEWQPDVVPELTLRGEVLNVFDEYYIDRATAFGGTIEPLAAPGRTFLVSGKVQY